ncbi:hypothetical protein H5410_015144 [Solanum commersonii]|uniref:Uncharacterized protein n=1 Tax=Solanum commersonii TaxID=4109 RepID=A0A9J5ZT07_SOLCO|nr:hypothetical protein H5410_015144 [Solanum commersonii]
MTIREAFPIENEIVSSLRANHVAANHLRVIFSSSDCLIHDHRTGRIVHQLGKLYYMDILLYVPFFSYFTRIMNGVIGSLMDSCSFHTNHRWLEESLWATKSLSTNGNNLSFRQFIVLFSGGAAPGSFNLLFIVQSHIGKLFLDVISQEAGRR